jgi:hypothetical protein
MNLQITEQQCSQIAYLLTIGYERKSSQREIRNLLQQLNGDASDLVSKAAANTTSMCLNTISLDGEESGVRKHVSLQTTWIDAQQDSDSSDVSDEVVSSSRPRKRLSPSQSSSETVKRRCMKYDLFEPLSSDDEYIHLPPVTKAVPRQADLGVEIPKQPLPSAIHYDEFDFSSPVSNRAGSPARPVSARSSALGDKPAFDLPEKSSHPCATPEEATTSNDFGLQGCHPSDSLPPDGCAQSGRTPAAAPVAQISAHAVSSLPLTPPRSCPPEPDFNTPNNSMEHPTRPRSSRPVSLPSSPTRTQAGTLDDPVHIKTESEDETYQAEVNAASKTRCAVRREKRHRRKERGRQAKADADEASQNPPEQPRWIVVGSREELKFVAQSTRCHNACEISSPTRNSRKTPATAIKTKPPPPPSPREKPALKSSNHASGNSSQRDRQDGQSMSTRAGKTLPYPSPKGKSIMNQAPLLAPSLGSPPIGPKAWRQSLAVGTGTQSAAKAALKGDRQVRTSARTPVYMSNLVGVTEMPLFCLDLAPLDNARNIPGKQPTLTAGASRPNRVADRPGAASQSPQNPKAKAKAKTARRRSPMKEHHGQQLDQQSVPETETPMPIALRPSSRIERSNSSNNETTSPKAVIPVVPVVFDEVRPASTSAKEKTLHRLRPKPTKPNLVGTMVCRLESLPNPAGRPWLPRAPKPRQATPAELYELGRNSPTNGKPKLRSGLT